MGKRHQKSGRKLWLGLGAVVGYALIQQGWALWQVFSKNVEQTLKTQTNEAPKGLTLSETTETKTYIRTHTVEDGIERIVYVPKERRLETPIVMQHGMWHGAWCWQLWHTLLLSVVILSSGSGLALSCPSCLCFC